MSKIENRCRSVDRNRLGPAIGKKDCVGVSSDWRDTEKILENNNEKVILFQRGVSDKNRQYHFILAPEENLSCLLDYSGGVVGYDTKYDFMSARFKTSAMTFCDNANKGRLGMVSISNKEDTTTHITNVQMVQANVKCSTQCTHNQKMYVFNDGDGFFRIRPCAMENQFKPLVQHDEARDIRNAVIDQNLETSLCHFHGLAAYREHIQQDPSLKNIMEPLLTGFKSVMRAWSSSVLDRLIIAYLNFISDLPTQIIPNECKEKLKSYLQNSWFSYPWKEAMSAEILFHLHPDVRSSPLATTNNITERKFKEIDSTDLNSVINKKMSSITWLLLDSVLYRDAKLSRENACETKHKRNWAKGGHIDEIRNALYILDHNGVYCLQHFQVHGWVLVTSQHHIKCRNMQVTPPLFDPNSRRDHDYDTQAKPRNFLDDLNHAASAAWRDEMKLHLPPQYKNVPIYQHICNLYLGICSCKSFISKGQPYLCKHLYAVHASRHNLKCEEIFLNLGKYMVPTLTPYLAEYFKINNHREMFGKSNLDVVNNLIAQSHKASTTEVNLAKQGKILTTLHSGPFQSTTFNGTPPKRAPHNAGKRRVGGPSLENRYSLTQQNFNCADPYVPKVEFPSNARGRHCGRKRTRTATRGTNICKLQEQAINKLENKMNEAGVLLFYHIRQIKYLVIIKCLLFFTTC